ncbi:MAG TPA: rcc01693 family protein [Microvirga sp.]|nr:rcc01693 family protein [Microvirga sp.]
MSEPGVFPWDDAMMLGLSVLRWSPDQFWRATPRELFAAWEGLSGGRRMEPAARSDLRRLMEAFPDGLVVV